MKFKNKIDEIQYDLLGLNEVEVRKRLLLSDVSKNKNKAKSRGMKNNWRRNKHKIMKGIKKWNKSTSGKRFHRALGRFNSLRLTEGITNQLHDGSYSGKPTYVALTMAQINDALLGLSSIETHLYLELQYYEADPEAMLQFLDIVDDFVMDTSFLKVELLSSYITGELEQENYLLLTDIVQFFQDPKMYVYAKRELRGKSNDVKTEDFLEQVALAESMDLTRPSNEIYDELDKLFVIK